MKKSFLSVFLALVLCLSLFPATALAADGDDSSDDNGSTTNETVTVTFNLNGGNINGSTENPAVPVDANQKVAVPAGIVRTGYSLVGWFRADDSSQTLIDLKTETFSVSAALTAKWRELYQITFDPAGGKIGSSQDKIVKYTDSTGKLAKNDIPQPPQKTGYEFQGWYKENGSSAIDVEKETFSAPTTLIAQWKEAYKITFDPNGGSIGSIQSKVVKYTDSSGKLPSNSIPKDPVKTGYEFLGWFKENSSSKINVDKETFTASTTLTAKWEKNADSTEPSTTYTITFEPNGGTVKTSSVSTGSDGKLTSLPNASRNDYYFSGWYTSSYGGDRITLNTIFKKDTTVYAHWSYDEWSDDGYEIKTDYSSGGRVTTSVSYADEGDRVTVTVRPNSGYELDSLSVTDRRDRELSLRSKSDNVYYFTMPDSRVDVYADFVKTKSTNSNSNSNSNTNSNSNSNTHTNTSTNTNTTQSGGNTANVSTLPAVTTAKRNFLANAVVNSQPMNFSDISSNDWYYNSVAFMWKYSLMGGVDSRRFSPYITMSNAMAWTMIARLDGADTASTTGVWYEAAMNWATGAGLTDGADPTGAVTRQNLIIMLWRYAGSPPASCDLGQFSDRDAVSTYIADCAFRWAVSKGIITGENGRLNPFHTATRAEVAAIMTRFCGI